MKLLTDRQTNTQTNKRRIERNLLGGGKLIIKLCRSSQQPRTQLRGHVVSTVVNMTLDSTPQKSYKLAHLYEPMDLRISYNFMVAHKNKVICVFTYKHVTTDG